MSQPNSAEDGSGRKTTRPQSARVLRRAPYVMHAHSHVQVARLLRQATVEQAAAAGVKKYQQGALSARELTPSPSPLTSPLTSPSPLTARPTVSNLVRRGSSSRRNLNAAVNYWEQESVWQHLTRAGSSLELVSAKWLASQFDKLVREGEIDWSPGEPLPRKALLSLDDLQSFHRSSKATPNAVVGGPKRLPIIAVSRDLAAAEHDEDGHELIRLVGGALRQRLRSYLLPYGESDPRHGPPDMGVFIDCMSLRGAAAANPLRGAVGDAIAVLFAHRLVTAYLCGEAEYEYHARSAYYRCLARLTKRARDETDPWQQLVNLEDPTEAVVAGAMATGSVGATPAAAPSAADAPGRGCALPAIQPPDAFLEEGELSSSIVFDSEEEQQCIGRQYKRVCQDAFFHARTLDFSLPMPEEGGRRPDDSWGNAEVDLLAKVFPLCRNALSLKLSGNGAISRLPDALGDIKPPPPLPIVRGAPKAKASSRVAQLQALECAGCSSLLRLPDGVCRLLNLRTINLEWCMKLHALPEGIGELRELRTLKLKGCEVLQTLPEGVGQLKPPWGTLEVLDLDFCASLTHLPKATGGLTSLQRLSLYGCRQLVSLPSGLRGLLSLHFFSFDGCTKIIGKLPLGELETLEQRGCLVQRPMPPPPPSAREIPTYKLGAMEVFTRKMYGLDIDPDNVDLGEPAGVDSHKCADPDTAGKGFVAGHITGKPLQLPDGDRYEGKYRDGKQEGRGTYYFADGRWYEGQWVSGRMEGLGTFHYARGNEYEGEFLDGRAHGHGRRLYADGDQYEGLWVAGRKEGRGLYRYANGDSWEGEWKAEKREGAGFYKYHDGAGDFEGEWKADAHKPDSTLGGPQSEAHEQIQLSQALMQENEEARVRVREIRGSVPLVFRRNTKVRPTDNELRLETAGLKEFIHGVAHKEFVTEILRARASCRTMLESAEAVFGKHVHGGTDDLEDMPGLRVFPNP